MGQVTGPSCGALASFRHRQGEKVVLVTCGSWLSLLNYQ